MNSVNGSFLVIFQFLNVPLFRNVTLKALNEIGNFYFFIFAHFLDNLKFSS